MRIFFIQKAHGLFASSGEYRANISFLKHLASLGHATAQVCYYQHGEVESCIKEVEEAGRSADLVKDTVQFDAKDGGSVSVDVSTFTNIDGIRMIAFDAESFEEVFPSKLYAQETIEYIEVSRDILLPSHSCFLLSVLFRYMPNRLLTLWHCYSLSTLG
jgi:hypothetical protein